MAHSSTEYRNLARNWHNRAKLMAAPLTKALRGRFKVRSIAVKAGDSVKVVAGGYKNRSGKVSRVDTRRSLVFIEGITEKGEKGKMKMAGISVENLQITKLDLHDKHRRTVLERRGASVSSIEAAEREQEEEEKQEEEKEDENKVSSADGEPEKEGSGSSKDAAEAAEAPGSAHETGEAPAVEPSAQDDTSQAVENTKEES
jgi:ribosomal protein uL24